MTAAQSFREKLMARHHNIPTYRLSGVFIPEDDYRFSVGYYADGNQSLSIRGKTGSHMISTNLDESPLERGTFFIKNWSENDGILESLVTSRAVEDTGIRIGSGFIKVPVVKLLAPHI